MSLTLKASFGHLHKLQELRDLAATDILTVATRQEVFHHRQSGVVTEAQERPYGDATVHTFLALIGEIDQEIIRLKHAIKRANVETIVDWVQDGRKLTLDEARAEAKRMRAEVDLCKRLGSYKSSTTESWNGREHDRDKDGKPVELRYRIVHKIDVTYDTQAMRKRAIKLEEKVNLLSSLIEQAEVTAPIDFEPHVDIYLSIEEHLDRILKQP